MNAVLEGIVTTQKKGGFKAFIRMGNVICLMMVIPVITFVKGNAKSGDTLISCFGGKNCIARVPRMRLCGKADLDNPLHRCLWICMAYQRELNEKVAQLSVPPETHPGKPPESRHQRRAWEKEMKEYTATLDAMLAHHCDNAFLDMKFGHNPFGIMLATPSDMMHLESDYNWDAAPGLDLDNVYKPPILRQHVNHGNDIHLRLTGKDDDKVQEPEEVPADDSSSNSSEAGSAQHCVTNNNKGPVTMNCSRHQFVYLLENLLVFHAMYKCGQPLFGPGSSPSDANDLLLLLHKLVVQIITYCPRQEGNKWKLQKLHELLHFPLKLFFFCHAKNFDAGTRERHLKDVFKDVKEQPAMGAGYIPSPSRGMYAQEANNDKGKTVLCWYGRVLLWQASQQSLPDRCRQ
jgi:hypothetical protein